MKDEFKLRREVQEHISKINSAKDIFELFKYLNYPERVLFDTSSKRKKDTFDFKKEDSERIKEIYSILSFDEKLPVFLIESKTLVQSFIRSVTTTFDKQYLHFLLIFATDYSEIVFVYPKREKIEVGKHKLKLTKLTINKKSLHYTDIQTLANINFEKEGTWRDVWRKWNKAFSVERVTESFFEDYKNIFFTLRKELDRQKISRKESHEFSLQFLNRIMFIYFISKKSWLSDAKFMEWFWTEYKRDKNKKKGVFKRDDAFYGIWLKQIFFKAFNNRSNEITDLPEDVIKVISNSPYLNGGLFRQNDLDELNVKITDSLFQKIFDFFEKYNFTIKEDMPLDSEVAVDPQMIGYVYESLANVAEEIYDRNDLGIFYTPRVEVDFMCRRSIVEYLSKQLPDIQKDKIYHLVFDLPEEKERIEKWFDKEKLWYKLEEVLDNLSAVDPACGSGAFLVGLLNVLVELYRIIFRHIKRDLSDFELKNKIIQYSLYGVDVMPWAIHAAELRLWLQLIVETEFKKEELRKHPLLPNLNLNLRIGDSLVQEMGGISFNVRTNNLKPHLKKKLDNLKQEKRKYFENSLTAKFKTPEEVKTEEIRLFEEIIDERIESLGTDIEVYETEIKKAKSQRTLTGEYKIDDKKVKENEARIEANEKEIEKLKKVKEVLKDPEKKPFIWDIDFAEIFGDKNGFDIVIGNPPYVRQEMISPPNKIKSEVSAEDRREYKEKLIQSVKNQFSVINKIDGRSDYYIYFYFHGLSLLNEKGSFCFITSNSWLDVGYGKNLQEFLLKYTPIHAIYDNPKRSFAHADVNTIIALFGAPRFEEERQIEGLRVGGNNDWTMLQNTAKFVMFKKPFEEVLSSQNLIEIENTKAKTKGEGITELVKNVVSTNDYRVFPIIQEDLLEDGWEYPEDYKNGRFKAGNYEGNKWGGKYLRAPDIFYTILAKGRGKLVRLGDIAKVRFGIKTGANEFFYLDEESQKKWNIEKEFLKPVIKSPRECKSIIIDPKDLKYRVFMCRSPKGELMGTNALRYIEWGEKQKTKDGILWCKVPSVSGRKRWYSMDYQEGNTFWVKETNDRLGAFVSERYMLCDCRLYFNKSTPDVQNFVNSSLMALISEILSRSGLGEGAKSLMVYEVNKFVILPKIAKLKHQFIPKNRDLLSIFSELGIDPDKPIREQQPKPLPDRAELDNIIFDELGLTKEERKEVYWAVCELVKQRLEKARSFNGKG
ncbi:MAG: Eco57I restriction-modification methylase domain-containing protein [Methanocellales archaeon]|nr:Eco57I restriction-modification methylase domain-containing protein [Methanocellales archaeon]MDD3292199.1 Eco57I restriction-modification methylase domain-containing protein [Methanocellales archaeon]MDD5235734.1 Eco57I restriction-modification methylase domain-containing protein [Methanocellales archaeon]MDD5485799.1 Eco57I restriction-modification methylase domain-containing protein [Methanocellales archaeon]